MKSRINGMRAMEIASHWHGGQGSALYSFASTGEFCIPLTLQYFKELQADIEPEYWHAREVSRTQRELKELKALQNWLLVAAETRGLTVEFHPHETYGYKIPYLAENVDDTLMLQVKPVAYLA
jgi:hypothetical protein